METTWFVPVLALLWGSAPAADAPALTKATSIARTESPLTIDGEIRSVEVDIGWRPSKHFSARVSYGIDEVELPQDEFEAQLVSAQFDFVFSNTVSWVNLIQYDNVSESIGLNSRLHWVPQAGRNVYLVLNHNYEERMSDNSFHSTTTDLTLKADYTFRF